MEGRNMSTDMPQLCSPNATPTAGYWREAILQQHFGLDCRLHEASSFHASLRSWDLGSIKLVKMTLSGHSVGTDCRIARQFQHEHLYLKLVVCGRVVFENCGHCTSVGAGGMVVVDPARQFIESFADPSELVLFMLPKRELRERGLATQVHGPLVQSSAASPDNAALWQFLLGATQHVENTSVQLRARLGAQILDFVDHLVDCSSENVHSRSAALTLVRIKDHIQRHLGDPNLGIGEIAAAMRLSPRSINRLFAAEGTSPMRYVWSCRLQRAHSILQDSTRNSVSIEEVSWRCGFSDAAHFSRSFKCRYGYSPRAFRQASVAEGSSVAAGCGVVAPVHGTG
jgi:AraC-like DNA-binding protein